MPACSPSADRGCAQSATAAYLEAVHEEETRGQQPSTPPQRLKIKLRECFADFTETLRALPLELSSELRHPDLPHAFLRRGVVPSEGLNHSDGFGVDRRSADGISPGGSDDGGA